jgi:hypothetical protein
MKALRVLTIGVAVALALMAGPVEAGDLSRPSVFPHPVDPWSHWGRAQAPVVIAPPRVIAPHRGAFVHQHAWAPGYWAWTGFNWVWILGYWVQ